VEILIEFSFTRLDAIDRLIERAEFELTEGSDANAETTTNRQSAKSVR